MKRTAWGVAGMGGMTGLYSWQVEPFRLEFVRETMTLPQLPPHLDGKLLMQISDTHVGDRFDYHFIIDSFKKAQAVKPDIVVYTGDFVNYENPSQFGQLNKVYKYAVKGKLATLGVLGNHDYGLNWRQQKVADNITDILDSHGIEILSNQKRSIEGLDIIGLDDYWAPNFRPRMGLSRYDSKTPTIVLCHNPDVCDLNVWADFKGWILSGHTHGGQCKPPFLPPPILPVKNKRYTSGAFDLGEGRRLYINRALGHLHQIRFNVLPEITIFKLEKA